jgi:hypothetical protein
MKSPVVSVSNLSTLSLGIFVASILLAGAPAARAASETWIGLSGTTGNLGRLRRRCHRHQLDDAKHRRDQF